MDKPFWHSKTFWVNVVAMGAMAVQSQAGFVIDADEQLGILAVINLILRFITKGGVTFTK